MGLEGKVALITGAARGIGKAIALRLASDGADVSVADICSPIHSVPYEMGTLEQLEAVVDEIKSLGRNAIAIKADVKKSTDVNLMIEETLNKLKRIDILVNNAGGAACASVVEMTEEQWDEIIDSHLKGTFLGCRAVLPHMIERKSGKIINLSSPASENPYALMSNYCAAKAGIRMFGMVLAREVAQYNITVNAVYPTAIPTDIWKGILPQYAKVLGTTEDEVYRIISEPDGVLPINDDDSKHISALVAFLVSSEGDFITGKTIGSDGGFVMHL
jgi:NAD(P)-dependent dehydrogenase (short-subunit alcohol dehydrogenase family)